MPERLLPRDVDFDGPFPRLSRRLRLGVVGGGRISVTQATAARLTGRWEVVAGALSSDADKAKARGADWYLPEERCYASYEEMARLEAQRPDGVDAVMITTLNHVHYDAARSFLEAGIDVLCDKPLTNELSEAIDLVRLTRETGLVFGVGYAMASFPMVRQARAMVREGAIGKVVQIHVEFLQDWMMSDAIAEADHVKWRLDPAKSGATSCTGDIGTHAQHIAAFVSGLDMTRLRAEMHVCGAPKALEDTVFMMTRFSGDVPGTLMASRIAAGNRGRPASARLRQRGRIRMGPRDAGGPRVQPLRRARPCPQSRTGGRYPSRRRALRPAGARLLRGGDRGLGQSLYGVRPGRRRAPGRRDPAGELAEPSDRRGGRAGRPLRPRRGGLPQGRRRLGRLPAQALGTARARLAVERRARRGGPPHEPAAAPNAFLRGVVAARLELRRAVKPIAEWTC
jgi:predicted dehydrogenase